MVQLKNTEWTSQSSPIVIVPQKGGKWQVCIDYKAFYRVTKKDNQPLPLIDKLLDQVVGHQVYTFRDGYSGYYEVKMKNKDISKLHLQHLGGPLHI